MEARYAFRKSQLLDEWQMAPEMFEQVIPRLYAFMKPFVQTFQGQAAAQHANTSVSGLRSDVERKNIASMAYRCGQSRLPLQGFLGWDAWDDAPLRHALVGHVKTHVGQADGVLVFDPSGLPKSGRESVGGAGSGAAGWAKSTPVKSPSPWDTSRGRAISWWRRGWTCPKQGRQRRPALTRPASRTPAEATVRVIHGPWRCWRNTGPRGRTGGVPVTTRWGVRIGFVVAWRPWASALCWRCPRRRRYALWRRRHQSPVGRGAAPRAPGKALRPGARCLTRRPGSVSMSATVRKVPLWSRWSNGAWSPEPIGVSKAMRNCWQCCAPVTATRIRS
jgi:hypothetical protein